MKHSDRVSDRSQRGSALIAALLLGIAVLAFTGSILMTGVASQHQSRYLAAGDRAQDAAESGIHYVIAKLGESGGKTLRTTGHAEGILQGSGVRAIRWKATLTEAGSDGIDNDLDGAIDEPDEADMIEVSCTGRADDVWRTVRVTVRARYSTPTMPSAVYIADPNASVNFNGNAFQISGNDVNLAGVPTGATSPGIGVAGDPSAIVSGLSAKDAANILGSGGTPSIKQVAPLDINTMIQDGARAANVTLATTGTTQPSYTGEWGTLSAPAILYGSGDVHISGGAEGAGIMIVNGNLDISGDFSWHGLIVVSGEVTFSGGGATIRLVGGLVVENNLKDNTTGLTGSGTVDVVYSADTLAMVSKALASYTVENWREGPNPPVSGW